MRVFLTGVAGYAGRHLAEELVDRGHELAVMVRHPREDAEARRLGVWPIRVRLEQPRRLRGIASEVEGIAHCAASDAPGFAVVNRAAIRAMLAGLPAGAGFVRPASACLYGDTGGASAFDGTEPYAPPPPLEEEARLLAELARRARRRGVRAAVVHAALVHGGGHGARLPRGMIEAARRLGWSGVPEGPDRVWSAVHVTDWAALMARALEAAPAGGATRHVAAAEPVSLRALAALVGTLAGCGAAPRPVAPCEAEQVWGPIGPLLFADRLFSPMAAAEALGWAPVGPMLATSLAELAVLMSGNGRGN